MILFEVYASIKTDIQIKLMWTKNLGHIGSVLDQTQPWLLKTGLNIFKTHFQMCVTGFYKSLPTFSNSLSQQVAQRKTQDVSST